MTATVGEIGAVLGVAPVGRSGSDRADVQVIDVSHDSRAIGAGWLFCCVTGANADGHCFAPDAVAAGASALLVERRLDLGVPELVVPDVRAAMGPAAALVHGRPSTALTVVGVTGTNGKSSVVQILADIWRTAGRTAEVLGTLSGARTTPESSDLQRHLAASRAAGTSLLAMEVSSHALALSRVAGTRFAAAVFTNLGRDHLDFHRDLAAYYEAKALLFRPELTSLAVVNRDDPSGARLIEELDAVAGVSCIPYGLDDAVGLSIDGPVAGFTWRGLRIELRLPGRHNVANALAAATAAAALGIDDQVIAAGLAATRPVRGRFELLAVERPFQVAVDYAHTPDALAAVLAAARDVAAGRVILVFGCGGDRDHDKRPEMGRVAGDGADLVVVTSDNPRSEDPLSIIAAIVGGIEGSAASAASAGHGAIVIEPDRRRAIGAAIGAAAPGDLVLIAGKGHETVQEIGAERRPFDDRLVALEHLGAPA